MINLTINNEWGVVGNYYSIPGYIPVGTTLMFHGAAHMVVASIINIDNPFEQTIVIEQQQLT